MQIAQNASANAEFCRVTQIWSVKAIKVVISGDSKQNNFFASTYWFISSGTMITYCPPLASYDENKSGLQPRLSTSYGGRLVRKMVTSYLSNAFWTVIPQVDKQRKIMLLSHSLSNSWIHSDLAPDTPLSYLWQFFSCYDFLLLLLASK